jgi:hypothetical protein
MAAASQCVTSTTTGVQQRLIRCAGVHWHVIQSITLTTSLRDRITRKSNAGSAAADDDDGDWMVCPITCEVIIDAAATKVRHLSFARTGRHACFCFTNSRLCLIQYAPKRFYEKQSLENWVRVRGSCPLTRQACSQQVCFLPLFVAMHVHKWSSADTHPGHHIVHGGNARAFAKARSEALLQPAPSCSASAHRCCRCTCCHGTQ